MIELFYRPDAETKDDRTEYYALVLSPLPGGTFFLVQLHIWWDEEQERPQRSEPVLEFIDDEAETERLYKEQRSGLMRLGFTMVLQGHSHDDELGLTYIHIPAPKRDVPS